MSKKTLVLGASENPSRYSNMAINRLRGKDHEVVAIGRRKGQVLDVPIGTEEEAFENIDTVTMYLNPKNQEEYMNYILSLKPKRIVFNPGTENLKLEALAKEHGIDTIEACTLVLLTTGQY
ncbi:MAG: CoA-binding protein [Chitinophagaceae bacterium]